MIKVMFVCHGNICRSTMAEFVFKDMVKKAGLESKFKIASSATSREEIGNGVHYGTRQKLNSVGISCEGKYAVQLTKEDYREYDYIIAMDSYNVRNIERLIGPDTENKVCKLLDFADGGDIADPWYTGNLDETYDDVMKGCTGLLKKLRLDYAKEQSELTSNLINRLRNGEKVVCPGCKKSYFSTPAMNPKDCHHWHCDKCGQTIHITPAHPIIQ